MIQVAMLLSLVLVAISAQGIAISVQARSWPVTLLELGYFAYGVYGIRHTANLLTQEPRT